MSILLVQLSDLHAKHGNNSFSKRVDAVTRAVAAEADTTTQAIVYVVCGDIAFGGKANEYSVADELLQKLLDVQGQRSPDTPVHMLIVPGNHDCDFTSEDQTARDALRKSLTTAVPADSIKAVMLKPQERFFEFSQRFVASHNALSGETPYYAHSDIAVDGRRVRFHLFNSSWSSVLKEKDDLWFPCEAFTPPSDPVADYSISVMHHPVRWFAPSIRKELRDLIENHCDLVLTGHEHDAEASRRQVLDGPDLDYLEGGVLQEDSDHEQCSFNTIRLDFGSSKQTVKKLSWDTDHFVPVGASEPTPLVCNSRRKDRANALKRQFELWLDEFEDPMVHPRENGLRLSHLFAYPDLRKYVSSNNNDEKQSEVTSRVRSDEVLDEIAVAEHVLILGGDKAGKTSVAKRLYLDLHRLGQHPLLIKGSDLSRRGSEEGLRRLCAKAVEEQYIALQSSAYEQLDAGAKTLIMDDFHNAPADAAARGRILSFLMKRFGHIILFASDDFYLELLNETHPYVTQLTAFQRYEICDFGHVRLTELTERWIRLGNPEADPVDIRNEAAQICERVESLLAVASLPHTPWLLLVMLEQVDSTDAPAAKNGSYGHLYQAIITVALSRSHLKRFDISGKYTYLAELAYYLHCMKKPTLAEGEARAFHESHCVKYDLQLDFEQVKDDLVETRLLRSDGNELAFRHKYVYCFFVAWWLSRNIHRPEAKELVCQLGTRLHHDTSANILVFLAHLTDDPIVLGEMKEAASRLFPSERPAEIGEDTRALNELEGVDTLFSLPPTPPDVNRKMLHDAQDEEAARSKVQSQYDGRLVKAEPDDDDEEESLTDLQRRIRDIRAAHRTIRILGQVLCNGATSIQADAKLEIMEGIVLLGRRLLGHTYAYLTDMDKMLEYVQKRYVRLRYDRDFESLCPQAETTSNGQQSVGSEISEDKVLVPTAEDAKMREEAELFANRFWFGLYWLATFSTIKRLATAVGISTLDPTMAKMRAKDESLPNHLIDLAMRLKRRGKKIQSDEIVTLHQDAKKNNNRLARVVLEAMVVERLILFDTDYSDKQKICRQMEIQIPKQSLDHTRKLYGPRK